MDKSELQQKLAQPFQSAQWKAVVEDVFPGSQFYAQARTIPTSEEIVEQIADKGTVRLADGKNIALVELQLKPGSVHLHRNRVKLRSLVAKLIDQERAHGVIAVFEQGSGDYRLSFVAREAILEDGEFKVQETPPKRYTYLLGPGETCRTAAERLYALSQKQELTLDDITDAFSVEKLNKEFYRHIQKYFYKLVGGKTERAEYDGCMTLPSKPITEPGNHKAYSEFAVRLLGRIVFCWFLKHKRCDQDRPLIPDELLSSNAVEEHPEYYHAILEKLFFQTLNKPMNERSKYAPEFAHLIPYLNGGLFDPHRDDFYEEGAMGMSKYIGTLKIPDDWFLDLFQTLEMYNFTIDENTALDSDVSIDPEILGRIFENLLAEINPETGDSARKSTGSFYTPREIVDYMVEESLLQHLKTCLTTKSTEDHKAPPCASASLREISPEEEQTLRALFVDDDSPHGLDDATRRAVINAFRTIKVLDPACGSGAFPVGILQKMLCALRKVDPENDLWLDAQFEQIESMNLSKAEEERRLREIEDAFKSNEADYGRKLGIIQNSVYGVDIQPIAIEISKLRFFLTLVVDEKIDEKANNRGILPLPNLDFKFVCANTLIPAPEMENTSGELDLEYYPDFFKDFTALTEQYFYAGTPREKQFIREQLSECVGRKVKGELDKVHELQGIDLFANAAKAKAEQKRIKECRAELVRNISLWESYNNIFTGQPVGFFDPKYMFPDASDGFDVLIANPPYFKENEDKARFDGLRSHDCYQGKMDVWYLFADVGLDLLKTDGTLSYIATNNWTTNAGASKLRNKIINEAQILRLIDFQDYMVFESASIQTMILVLAKSKTLSVYHSLVSKALPCFSHSDLSYCSSRLKQSTSHLATFDVEICRTASCDTPLLFNPSEKEALLRKIENNGALYLAANEITQGIVPNPDKINSRNIKRFSASQIAERNVRVGDGVFVIDEAKCSFLDHGGRNYLQTIYEPIHIEKYRLRDSSMRILYLKKDFFDPSDSPAIIRHLDRYREVMEARRENLNGRISYYHLHWPRDENIFKQGEKILVPRKCTSPIFHYTKHQAYVMLAVNVIRSSRINMQYLSALLNSSLMKFWLFHKGSMQGANYQLDAGPLQRIPIASPPGELEDRTVQLHRQAVVLMSDHPKADVSTLEAEIDQIVYKLYDLTPEEIAIIEGVTN